jgi:hypothetical protein
VYELRGAAASQVSGCGVAAGVPTAPVRLDLVAPQGGGDVRSRKGKSEFPAARSAGGVIAQFILESNRTPDHGMQNDAAAGHGHDEIGKEKKGDHRKLRDWGIRLIRGQHCPSFAKHK